MSRTINTSVALTVSILAIHTGSAIAECAEARANGQLSAATPTGEDSVRSVNGAVDSQEAKKSLLQSMKADDRFMLILREIGISFEEAARRVALFKALEYAPSEDKDRPRYLYRLFVPRQITPNKTYPLLVWLHGYGESGDDNWRHLFYIQDEVNRWEEQKGGFPCFVLVPQSPFEGHWQDEMLTVVLQLTRRTIDDWPIDEDRVYAAGVCSGADACWKLGAIHPDLFAALAPMTPGSTGDVSSSRSIPIWAFSVTDDPVHAPDGVRATVAAIQELGGSCWLTETACNNSYNCWSSVFREYALIDWFLQQRRGRPATPPPFWASWKSYRGRHLTWDRIWPPMAVLGAIAALVMVVRRQLRTSKSEAKSSSQENGQGRRHLS